MILSKKSSESSALICDTNIPYGRFGGKGIYYPSDLGHTNILLRLDVADNAENVLVFPFSGYGDELMYSRFVKNAAKKYNVKYISYDVLSELFKQIVDVPKPTNIKPYEFIYHDLHEYVLEEYLHLLKWADAYTISELLGLHVSPSTDTIFSVEPVKLKIDKPSIGLCWESSATSQNISGFPIKGKNYTHDQIQKLIENIEAEFYCLNPYTNIPKNSNIKPCSARDFYELARLIAALDLVITCDTAVLHLATILGKKTICLLNVGGIDETKSVHPTLSNKDNYHNVIVQFIDLYPDVDFVDKNEIDQLKKYMDGGGYALT